MKLRRVLGAVVVVGSLARAAVGQDTLQWSTDLATAQRTAAQTNRMVLLHFWGTWCPPCMKMENEVFTKPGLGAAIHPYFVPCKIQVEDDLNKDLAKQFGVDGYPCDIVLTPAGQVVSRSKGFKPAAEYLAMLNQAAQIALKNSPPAAAASVPAAPPVVVVANAAPAAPTAPNAPQAASASQGRTAPTDDRYAYYYQDRGAPKTESAAASPTTAAPRAAPLGPTAPQPQSIVSNPVAPRDVAAAPQVAAPTPGAVAPPTSASPATSPSPPIAAPPTTAPNVAAGRSVPPSSPSSVPSSHSPSPNAASPNAALRLPPGTPPAALDGYCPVTVTEKMVWKRGDVRFGAIHRGRTYLFATSTEQAKFLADPDRFSPIISGNDPVVALERGEAVPGKRELGIMCGERMILFASQESYDKFVKDSKRYSVEIQQALLSDQAGTIRR